MLISLCLLFGSFDASYGTELNNVEAFIEDIIKMWQLRSPTILINDDLPNLCIYHQWRLCLLNDLDAFELTHHMKIILQALHFIISKIKKPLQVIIHFVVAPTAEHVV